ncbi:MAG: carbon-nitrogen hydrolase family protein [Acidobacteria bacterium]|nr:carbon-nitrogen hydrolase family protein [Acidobacteriota bacterium]
MKDHVCIAAVSVESKSEDTAGTLALLRQWAARASGEGAEIVLFPELSVCGFIPNHPLGDHAAWLREALLVARRAAEPVPGPSTQALHEIASEMGVILCAGLLEDARNLLYNSAVLVGPEGLIGVWRKMHVPMFEMPFYSGGPAPPVVATPFGHVGINICFDALMPESTRLLAAHNVEIVLFPFAADPAPGTQAAWGEWAEAPLRARCSENGVFGVACNYMGHVVCAGVEQTFPGGAMVIGPRGEVVASQLEGGNLLVATLHRDTLLQARADPDYLYRFVRKDLYGPLG